MLYGPCPVRNCKLVGINMTEASLRNVVLNNCNASYAVLRYFKCSNSAFDNTSFTEADIYAATLANDLRGCIIAPAQAITLAAIFGVVIKDS